MTAAIPEAGDVEVTDKDGKKNEITGKNILVATGVVVATCRDFRSMAHSHREQSGHDATEAAEGIIVIGAGAIGIEFAYFFNAFRDQGDRGRNVAEHSSGRGFGSQRRAGKVLTSRASRFSLDTKIDKTEARDKGEKITVAASAETIEAERASVAIGVARAARRRLSSKSIKGLARDQRELRDQREGRLCCGRHYWAPWLAHVASFEAVQAVEGMFESRSRRK